LLAFLLAFVFGIAAARFDTRSDLIVDEARATGAAHLYAGLLPPPQRERSRELLREHVALRIEGVGRVELNAAHQERLAKAPGRLPPFVWWALYFLTAAALVSPGYPLGLARSRRPVIAVLVVLSLATVVTMIMDLDRGQQGLLTVSQQALEHLLAGMRAEAP
jgi:hypothetical protein